MKGEDEKLKPPEARVGVCAGVHARVRARRVHKLSTRTERADGEDVDAHRLKSGACARFLQSCRAVLPFAVGSRRVAGKNGFSLAENAYGVPRHASSTRRAEGQWHPVIQTAPRTANKAAWGAVEVWSSRGVLLE